MENNYEPQTLQEAIQHFSYPENCLSYVARKRWPSGVVCPTCGSHNVSFLKNQQRWQCSSHHDKRQFSVKVGTIFEDSPLGLDKWLPAVWMLENCKNGVSSWELHRALGVTQKTAWFMLHRIRLILQDPKSGGKLGGEVEVDETYIGGKARNMHWKKRRQKITAPGPKDKVAVMGMVKRGGEVRTFVVGSPSKEELQGKVRSHVEAGAALFSDDAGGYDGLEKDFAHEVVDHAVEYVRGNVHTNTMENFWSLLKRGLHGTYVSVEPFHLFRYVDEQAFRYNNRKHADGAFMTDAERFGLAMSRIVGKRLTYAALTGKLVDPQTSIN